MHASFWLGATIRPSGLVTPILLDGILGDAQLALAKGLWLWSREGSGALACSFDAPKLGGSARPA